MSLVSTYVVLAGMFDELPAPWIKIADNVDLPFSKLAEASVWIRVENYGPEDDEIAVEVAAFSLVYPGDRMLITKHQDSRWKVVPLPLDPIVSDDPEPPPRPGSRPRGRR